MTEQGVLGSVSKHCNQIISKSQGIPLNGPVACKPLWSLHTNLDYASARAGKKHTYWFSPTFSWFRIIWPFRMAPDETEWHLLATLFEAGQGITGLYSVFHQKRSQMIIVSSIFFGEVTGAWNTQTFCILVLGKQDLLNSFIEWRYN